MLTINWYNCAHVVFHGALSCWHRCHNWSLQSTHIVCSTIHVCFTFSCCHGLVSNQSSLACVTDLFDQDKLDIKGKAKECNDVGPDVVDLTFDNSNHALDNASDEWEDHKLVKKLLTSQIGLLYFSKLTTWFWWGPRGSWSYMGLGEAVSLEAASPKAGSACTCLHALARCSVVPWTRACFA